MVNDTVLMYIVITGVKMTLEMCTYGKFLTKPLKYLARVKTKQKQH